MPRYRAMRDTWISHECFLVKKGDEFETVFPAGMRIGDNIELIEDDPQGKAEAKPRKPPVDKSN